MQGPGTALLIFFGYMSSFYARKRAPEIDTPCVAASTSAAWPAACINVSRSSSVTVSLTRSSASCSVCNAASCRAGLHSTSALRLRSAIYRLPGSFSYDHVPPVKYIIFWASK